MLLDTAVVDVGNRVDEGRRNKCNITDLLTVGNFGRVGPMLFYISHLDQDLGGGQWWSR